LPYNIATNIMKMKWEMTISWRGDEGRGLSLEG
jgi:hypothetical protein